MAPIFSVFKQRILVLGSTYLTLVNKVLRMLNEVELTEDNFDTARGLHASAKEAVRSTVSRINKMYPKWPFNAVEVTQVLTIGQEEYDWPTSFKEIDWNSFFILKDTGLNITSKPLQKINKEEWYSLLRSKDEDAGALGRDYPRYVFNTHGNKFGISPSPDKEYTLNYRYWDHPPTLDDMHDEITIPDDYDYVIIAGSIYLMKLFKSDVEQANVYKQEFTESMREMRSLLINQDQHLQDRMIRR